VSRGPGRMRRMRHGFETCLLQSPHRPSLWFQARPRFYMAGVKADIQRGQDGRVAKASVPYIVATDVCAVCTTGSSLVFDKFYIGRRVGSKHVRDSIWLAPKLILCEQDGRLVKARAP
jgi:hypothetical protein